MKGNVNVNVNVNQNEMKIKIKMNTRYRISDFLFLDSPILRLDRIDHY